MLRNVLDDDAEQDPAALMIQRQYHAFKFRKRMHQAVEKKKEIRLKAAVKIQSWIRGFRTRQVTKYGLGFNVELVSTIKSFLEQHEQRPGPYKYNNRPHYKDILFR